MRINPLHPGAHHELVHHYEGIRRPALGWPHAVGYIQSSPGIPHAFHMQAHLGTRIGKWDKSTEWSLHGIELEIAYHKEQNVKPSEDAQFPHHLEVLMLGLTHDGRFAEAEKFKKICQDNKYQHTMLWYRLHLAERDYGSALKLADDFAKKDKLTGAYLRALVYLKKGGRGPGGPGSQHLAPKPIKRSGPTKNWRFDSGKRRGYCSVCKEAR